MAKTPRLHQSIARTLGMAIVSGDYQPGDSLEGEIEQSVAMGVSRTPYREAIRILTAKGMLESKPKAGTRVTPRGSWNLLDPDVLAWMFSGEPDRDFVRALFELRGVIEPAAAAFAAQRRTSAHVAAMADALSQMALHGLSIEAGQAADQEFHRIILAAADNEPLATLASSVGASVSWTTRFKQRRAVLPRDPVPDHAAVFAAIEDGDGPRARIAMETLLRLAFEDMGLD